MFQKLLQEVTLGYTTDTVRQKFTGYERDNESELDYAQARYFSYNHGRFTSADPMRESAKADAPQTWNRFSYVVNNPFKYIDPTGKCTAPSGLKPGQVGICFEAFIAARRVGPGGIGHGDGRDFAGNDPSKTARVTVWAIVSTDEKMVNIEKSDKVSESEFYWWLENGITTPIASRNGNDRCKAIQYQIQSWRERLRGWSGRNCFDCERKKRRAATWKGLAGNWSDNRRHSRVIDCRRW